MQFLGEGVGGGGAPDGKLRKHLDFGLIHGGSGRLRLKETLLYMFKISQAQYSLTKFAQTTASPPLSLSR